MIKKDYQIKKMDFSDKIYKELFSRLEQFIITLGAKLIKDDWELLKNMAFVKFAYKPYSPATIIYGIFDDPIRELTTIAHEAGHLMLYYGLPKEKAEVIFYTMLSANKMGLKAISKPYQMLILHIEAIACSNGLHILRNIGFPIEELLEAKKFMLKCYRTYETNLNLPKDKTLITDILIFPDARNFL